MIPRIQFSEPGRRLYDRLADSGQLARRDELAATVRAFVAQGMTPKSVVEFFEDTADRLDLDTDPEPLAEFKAAVLDLAAQPT